MSRLVANLLTKFNKSETEQRYQTSSLYTGPAAPRVTTLSSDLPSPRTRHPPFTRPSSLNCIPDRPIGLVEAPPGHAMLLVSDAEPGPGGHQVRMVGRDGDGGRPGAPSMHGAELVGEDLDLTSRGAIVIPEISVIGGSGYPSSPIHEKVGTSAIGEKTLNRTGRPSQLSSFQSFQSEPVINGGTQEMVLPDQPSLSTANAIFHPSAAHKPRTTRHPPAAKAAVL